VLGSSNLPAFNRYEGRYTKRFAGPNPAGTGTLKKPVSKAEIRAELERATAHFLQDGGEVERVPQGVSGKDPGDPPLFLNRRLFLEPPATRTLVPEVVAAIEARRKQRLKRTPVRKRSRLPQPRRKVIYDDFGEPLRRVWVDD
jgi:hypothetical protein